MNPTNSDPPAFPGTFIKARESADAAWHDERVAWTAIRSTVHPERTEVLKWYRAWLYATEVQAAYDRHLELWRRDAKLP